MQVNLSGHHVEITPALKDYLNSKMDRIERHFDSVTSIHCILTVEKLRHKAEAKINVTGGTIFAEAVEEDMYAAIDGMVDKLDRQIVKHKEKLTDHHARESHKRDYSNRAVRQNQMRLIIVSGLSGSGKSVALHLLEDLNFYCIDNVPAALLDTVVTELVATADSIYDNLAVGVDARNRSADLESLPDLVMNLRERNIHCEVIFLQADDSILLKRYSETRRKHPLSDEGLSLADAIARERELLGPIIDSAELVLDTTRTNVYELRDIIRERVGQRQEPELSILIESFGFKHGLPSDADFVFDLRCLPNPYWEIQLRQFTGRDAVVIEYLDGKESVQAMYTDILAFLEKWIPQYIDFNRNYLTVALGCTGGQHRSVYMAEKLTAELQKKYRLIQTRHNELREDRHSH